MSKLITLPKEEFDALVSRADKTDEQIASEAKNLAVKMTTIKVELGFCYPFTGIVAHDYPFLITAKDTKKELIQMAKTSKAIARWLYLLKEAQKKVQRGKMFKINLVLIGLALILTTVNVLCIIFDLK